MFKFFKKKCPVCKMELAEEKSYPQSAGKKFCSEECQEEYRQKLVKAKSKSGGSCCH